MKFNPVSFILGAKSYIAPVDDVISFLMGRAVSATEQSWRTITNVAIADFTTVSTTLGALVIDVTPVQFGSGDPSPTNARPISGWTGANISRTGKNLFDASSAENGYVTADGTINTDNTGRHSPLIPVNAGEIYTFSGYANAYTASRRFHAYDANGNWLEQLAAKTDSTLNQWYALTAEIPAGARYVRLSWRREDTSIMLEMGSARTTYEAFGTVYPVSWQSEAGEVYGGALDVTTGILTITHIAMTLGDIEALTDSSTGTGKFARYDFPPVFVPQTTNPVMVQGEAFKSVLYGNRGVAWTGSANLSNTFLLVFVPSDATVSVVNTALSGTRAVMELVTPQIVQLTPTEVNVFIGVNNIFADCGNINTITYRER